ncbi:MAG: hypothetical protein EZS28_013964 [Streblomastix strix]|uniref:KilA-N domain-containing protein n=1 Tax=Streblomastix strix TaxID=222440 RepID=A0A5J4W752_9EUKA|nr:MAG: hypothetical protein EZS28_013964 [Streblomastix strix]
MQSPVESNGQETFIKTSYNGIEITIRKSDLYVNASKLVISLRNNDKKYRGYWVHRKLVNYIAIWVSPKYASIVGNIMDKINETTIVEQEANKANDRMNCVQKVVDDVTDFLSARITK